MARIKFGNIAADVRGKCGGISFSRSRGVATVRSKSNRLRKNSRHKSDILIFFASVNQFWRSLTDAERKTWVECGDSHTYTDSFGDVKIRTGKNLFVWINFWRIALSIPPFRLCPSPSLIAPPLYSVTSFNPSAGLFQITAPYPSHSGRILIVKASPPLSSGRKFFTQRDSRYVGLYAMDAPLAQFNIYNDYVDVFEASILQTSISYKISLSAEHINVLNGCRSYQQFFTLQYP